ncbi:transposase [Streptomyces sp. NBC_00490]
MPSTTSTNHSIAGTTATTCFHADCPALRAEGKASRCGAEQEQSQADFVCVSCGFTCNADENAATNVAAGRGGFPRLRRTAGDGGVTAAIGRSSAREPQPAWVGIPLF